MKLITVKTFDNLIDAYLFRSKLESEDVTCYLFDEHIVGLDPLYNITVGGIKLKINEADAEVVSEIFKSIDEQPFRDEDDDIILCPSCDSDQLISGYKSMKGIKGFFSAIVSLSFGAYPLYYKTVYKCKNCNYEFKSDIII